MSFKLKHILFLDWVDLLRRWVTWYTWRKINERIWWSAVKILCFHLISVQDSTSSLSLRAREKEQNSFLKSHVSVGWNYCVIEGETFLKCFISIWVYIHTMRPAETTRARTMTQDARVTLVPPVKLLVSILLLKGRTVFVTRAGWRS